MRTPRKEKEETNIVTNKQHVPATHLVYQSKKHTKRTTDRKTKARPRREKGERIDLPIGKTEMPTAPLKLTSHPPDPRRSREGRAISKRGVGGIPVSSLGTREPNQKEGRKRQTRKAPGPIANHPGPRSARDLDPGVEMQWAGGPRTEHGKRRLTVTKPAVCKKQPHHTKPKKPHYIPPSIK